MTDSLHKEQWTDEQREIWHNVENYTDLIIKGDIEGFLEYFHRDYSGWNYLEALPVSKNDLKMELSGLPKHEVDSYNLIPLVINIIKDVAIIHYYYSIDYSGIKGEKVSKKGRNTDILLHQKNKWLLIGDHVGYFKDQ